ncbi:MAG: hypothetical protein QGI08_07750 [Paracoccaceae bacterium]|jgi:hypothetical protein|nr:hypothetical protein [Paracoccaceae bacterium]MDP7185597.1 hypothetical protein [Paracoccaceae bacterium]
MAVADAKNLSASDAISRAKAFFDEFFADQVVENVLLEELDYDETEGYWLVTIGFDVGRMKIRQPSQNALAFLADQEITPIREARVFRISDETGMLLKMEDV